GNSSAVYPEWIASMVQSVNLYYVSCSPDCPPGSVFTSVYWSLGLEEQFYIVLPFVLFFVPRRWLAPLLTVLFVIQFPLNRPQAPPNALWYMRTDAIVLGVLIALGHHDGHLRLLEPTFLKQRLWRWAAIPALIFLIGAISHTAIWLSTGLIAIACAALVLIASFNADYVMTDGMTKRCFMWIGSRSFALYLIHLPVYSFTRWVVSLWKNPATPYSDHQTWVFVLIAWPILLLTAEANFRLIESPLRRHGRRMADVVAQRSRLASVRP
ncbi:MAG: acyltransferase family protein, partial [Janthinobacterium lividum]